MPFILYPTEVSQWHTLINEAQAQTQLLLNDETESYLVFLLMRFTKGTALVDSTIALDFLHAQHQGKQHKLEQLQAVGDKSLILSGLFPGIAERRRVSISYFTTLGQTAYLSISEIDGSISSELYYDLSQQFVNLQQVLSALRQHP